MEISWSTFVLEIINFLVLVWILKHFFYNPVLAVIARRRAGIEQALADANNMQEEAKKLQTQYEGRLSEWDKERQAARDNLQREIEAERTRKLEALNTELEQTRQKMRVTETHRLDDVRQKIEATALDHGARFATRLLEQTASADTEAQLIDLLINELSQFPAENLAALRNNLGTAPAAIRVTTAFPLPAKQQGRLEKTLLKASKLNVPVHYTRDQKLLAGAHITIGAWVLDVNLRDELKGFAVLSHDEATS